MSYSNYQSIVDQQCYLIKAHFYRFIVSALSVVIVLQIIIAMIICRTNGIGAEFR